MSNFRASTHLLVQPHESGLDRMYVEGEKLKIFPEWRLVARAGRITAATGGLQPRPGGQRYPMRIEIPDSYPYAMPSVLTNGWTPQAGTPHRYGENRLCVMRASQWTSTFTIAFMVAKTALWLAKYEVWCKTSRWPGNQQSHGFWAEMGELVGDLLS